MRASTPPATAWRSTISSSRTRSAARSTSPSNWSGSSRGFEDAFANRGKLTERLKAKPLPRTRAEAFDIEPNVIVDTLASNRFTVVEVNARDGPALLNRLAQALFQSKVMIHSAHVATYGERAVDTFYLTDLTGEKIGPGARLKTLERRLLDAAKGWAEVEAA